MTDRQPYSTFRFKKISTFDSWFNRNEKTIMKYYNSYCQELNRNEPLQKFSTSLYYDYFFGQDINFN